MLTASNSFLPNPRHTYTAVANPQFTDGEKFDKLNMTHLTAK